MKDRTGLMGERKDVEGSRQKRASKRRDIRKLSSVTEKAATDEQRAEEEANGESNRKA